jgi:hypothetical protein
MHPVPTPDSHRCFANAASGATLRERVLVAWEASALPLSYTRRSYTPGYPLISFQEAGCEESTRRWRAWTEARPLRRLLLAAYELGAKVLKIQTQKVLKQMDRKAPAKPQLEVGVGAPC